MIRVAIVGAGRWGPNLVGNFQQSPRSCVHWVIERDPERRAAVAERFAGVRVGDDVERAIADDEVDAVVIATPTTTHFELARLALERGKHVLVEKPLTHSVETSEELTRLAAKMNRVLMVGHVFLFNAAARLVKEYIESGELGRIYYISMVRTNLGPIRVDVDAAWDLAAHDIALASHWLDGWPVSVSAAGGAWINPGIADAVFATLRYPGDVLINLHASWLNPRKARNITVVGDHRMLTFDDVNLSEPLRVYDKHVASERSQAPLVDSFGAFRMLVRDGDITIPRVPMSEPLRNECEHFLDCVEAGEVSLAGGAEGLAVVKVLDAISRSLAAGGREMQMRD